MKIIQLAHRTVDELLEEIFAITSKQEIDTNDRRVLYALACAMKNRYENDVPQWIPVEKELPEPRIDVWVNSDLGQMVGYYEEMVNLWYGRDYLELIVNAWMPLPEAYKPNK